MKANELDRALETFDYSQLSGVRESLLTELLQKRREDRMQSASRSIRSSILNAKRLSLEEMGQAVAAGKLPGADELRGQESEIQKRKEK